MTLTGAVSEESLYQPSLLRALGGLLEILPVTEGAHAALGFLPCDPKTLIRYSALIGYLELDAGRWHLTDNGQRVFSAQNRYRAAVMDLTRRFRPSWVRVASQGRAAVARYRPDLPLVHCFQETGLMTGTDPETIAFWDLLGGLSRSRVDELNLATGRDGERLSMEHERARTDREPRWRAVDLAGLGYDILSCRSTEDERPLYLEVKASTLPWASARLHLTANEWRFLRVHLDDAVVDCWSMTSTGIRHARLLPATLEVHIPQERGQGTWESVGIDFRALADEPQPITS